MLELIKEHQQGLSVQVSTSKYKYKYPKYSSDLNLGEGLYNVSPFISQILDFIYWTVLIFILIYFEWRDTENHQ